uniref:Uncharacterized protein n=1 Tax=Pelusios castaneus TaxID=367368 RepID=A0A8C8VMA4_9SAUR
MNPAVRRLLREAVCSSCQGPYKIPVTFKGCKHKFCRFCVTCSKGKSGIVAFCPLCQQVPGHKEVKPKGQPVSGGGEAGRISPQVSKEPAEEWECEEHQEVLNLFCAEDQTLVCRSCRDSLAHCAHTVVPIEEAAQEYKVGFCACDILYIVCLNCMPTSPVSSTSLTRSQKMRIELEFEKLHEFLDEEEEQLLRKLKKEKKETLQKLNGNITKLSEQNASLQKLIKEIEEKCQQPAAELLKVRNSLWQSQSLPFAMTLIFSLSFSPVGVTLDPDTAHSNLILSEDRKSVTHGDVQQELPSNPERFDPYIMVLGSRKITSGKCYWEVEVGDKVEWDLGVCRESVGRKGQIILSPSNGFWRVWLRNGNQYKGLISHPVPLAVSVRPTRVGIFLDYKAGEILFYNVTNKTLLYSYSAAFYGPLRPFFSPGLHRGGENATPLTIDLAEEQA